MDYTNTPSSPANDLSCKSCLAFTVDGCVRKVIHVDFIGRMFGVWHSWKECDLMDNLRAGSFIGLLTIICLQFHSLFLIPCCLAQYEW